ncbi:MAG: GAF domain-containing SpoIIE family protein phosphatase [Planctomycetota bacterium]
MPPVLERDEQIRLIESVCDRFERASGWPLRFVSAVVRDGDEAADAHPPVDAWRREISLEARPVGWLTLGDRREDAENASASAGPDGRRARELAELTAGLIEQTLTARYDAVAGAYGIEAMARLGTELPQDAAIDGGLDRLTTLVRQLTGYRATAFFLFTADLRGVMLRDCRHVATDAVPAPHRSVDQPAPDFASLVNGPVAVRRGEGDADRWLPPEMNSALCLPVPTGDGPIGTLWAFDRRARKPQDRDLHVAASVAAQIGGLLERAVLRRHSEDGHRLDRELSEASENEPPPGCRTLGGDGEDFTAVACTTSAGYIGGDLCEIIPVGGRRQVIAIGDACGHGVPAAMVMATARGIIRAVVHEHRHDAKRTDRLVAAVNRSLCELTKPHQFMSLMIATFDGPSRTVTYTNAGHPCPLHVTGDEVRPLDSHGLLPGVSGDAEYERGSVKLAADDLLVVFSDGVTEAMSRQKVQFRSGGIVDAIKEVPSRDPQDVLMAIWRRMEAHLEGGHGDDDRTLMVLRADGV